MAELVQWATAASTSQQNDGISPRTITPKSSFNNDKQTSPIRASSVRNSPARAATFSDDYGRQSSPLRAEFKPDLASHDNNSSTPTAPAIGVRFDQIDPEGSSSAAEGFRLQQPPKGKRKASDYFSRHSPVARTTDSPRDVDQPLSSSAKLAAIDPQTPRRRRSVQFTRSIEADGAIDGRSGDLDTEDPEDIKSRQSSLFARLKSLATPSSAHTRQQSAGTNMATPYIDSR